MQLGQQARRQLRQSCHHLATHQQPQRLLPRLWGRRKQRQRQLELRTQLLITQQLGAVTAQRLKLRQKPRHRHQQRQQLAGGYRQHIQRQRLGRLPQQVGESTLARPAQPQPHPAKDRPQLRVRRVRLRWARMQVQHPPPRVRLMHHPQRRKDALARGTGPRQHIPTPTSLRAAQALRPQVCYLVRPRLWLKAARHRQLLQRQ